VGIVVYNTLSKRYEEFEPIEEGHVKIYVCGITPYDSSHIGHARPAVFWDVVRRYLLHNGYKVTLVTNFTDIEDKLIRRSQETGIPPTEIAEKYAAEYIDAMDRLGVKRANAYPRASQVIPDIIQMIETLVEKGFAYESSGDVYFRAERFEDYGALSGKNLDELMPGARIQVSDLKESPLDFALWKTASDDEPGWHSPWGRGRPGWHIECSVMVLKFLGPSIDMHGGGTELVFPHHENEIAQAEAFSGVKPYVKYWVHNEMVNLEGEKMSKSIGNVIRINEILEAHDPMAVRLYLLSAHRRKILEFSEDLLGSAEKGWSRIQTCVDATTAFLLNPDAQGLPEATLLSQAIDKCRKDFFEAMNYDFNTPGAIAAVFDLVTAINSHVVTGGETTSHPSARQKVAEAYGLLMQCLGILGLTPQTSEAEKFQGNDFSQDLLEILVDMRDSARKGKDFKTADYIRDRLSHIGFLLEDTPSGTRIRHQK
jgi:cysteinyl-tRNA synthetase